MKLKNIHISNFRSIKDLSVNLKDKPVTVLYGENGKGKSSFLDSIQYAFSGTQEKGSINIDAESMMVEVTLDDNVQTTFSRQVFRPNETLVNGESVSTPKFKKLVDTYQARGDHPTLTDAYKSLAWNNLANYDADIYSFLKDGKVGKLRFFRRQDKALEVVMPDGKELFKRVTPSGKCLLNGKNNTFAALDSTLSAVTGGDIKAFKISTASEFLLNMDSKEFGAFLMKIAPLKADVDKMIDLIDVTPEEEALLRMYFPTGGEPITLNVVQDSHKAMFEKRTEIHRRYVEQKHREYKGMLPLQIGDLVRSKLEDLIEQEGAYNAAMNTYNMYQQHKASREQMLQNIKDLKKKLAQMTGVSKPDPSRLQALRQESGNLDNQIVIASGTLSRIRVLTEQAEKMLRTLDTSACPLHKDLVCSTDKTPVRDSLNKTILENKEEEEKVKKLIDELKKASDKNRQETDRYLDQQREWNSKESLIQQITNLTNNIPPIGQEPPMPQKIDNLEYRKAKLQEYIRQADEYQAGLLAEKKAKEIKKEEDLYSDVLLKTNPKNGEIIKAIMAYILTPIKKYCEDTASLIFPDMGVKFEIIEDLKISLSPRGKTEYIEMENLSSGEKMLLAFLLMDMVSSISGTRMLVFDNLEQMDEEAIDKMLDLFEKKEVLDRYDHVFFSAVKHPSIKAIIDKHNFNVIEL